MVCFGLQYRGGPEMGSNTEEKMGEDEFNDER